MLIGAYGIGWSKDEVAWDSRGWQLLGRRGQNRPAAQVCDFRTARGVYILLDHWGVHYVGLAASRGGLGKRLRDHTRDVHAAQWQRFHWFSFDAVSKDVDASGLSKIEPRDQPVPSSGRETIGELEALLITVLGTRNQNQMRFKSAQEWLQVQTSYENEVQHWLSKVTPVS